MTYPKKFLDFISVNVTSHELNFFTVTDVAKSIIEFNLFLKGHTASINYGLILTSLFSPENLLKNTQFSKWLYIKIGAVNLNISKDEFNNIINDDKRRLKILKNYFNVNREKETKDKLTSRSLVISPYTKSELDLCDKIYLNLHEFQIRIKDRLANTLIHNNQKRTLVQMPTGSGKTRTTTEFIIDHIRSSSVSLHKHNIYLWFTNTIELSEQAFETFVQLWKFRGDRPVGVHKLYGDTKSQDLFDHIIEENVSMIFIGFQKFHALFNSKNYADSRLLQLIREDNVITVVDEAHISLANTYDRAIEFVSSFDRSKLIGLTATPGRNSFIVGGGQNEQLAQKFHFNIIELNFKNRPDKSPIEILQEQGYLSKVTINEIKNYSNLAANSPIENLAFDFERNKKIIEAIQERYEENLSLLVFSASTAHSVILKSCLEQLKIHSEIVDSYTSNEARTRFISEFKNGKLKILINFGVLSTGFDAPILDCLIVARPISSLVLFSQIMGRALRGPKNGGNEKNEILIVKDKMINYPNADFLYSYWNSFWI